MCGRYEEGFVVGLGVSALRALGSFPQRFPPETMSRVPFIGLGTCCVTTVFFFDFGFFVSLKKLSHKTDQDMQTSNAEDRFNASQPGHGFLRAPFRAHAR